MRRAPRWPRPLRRTVLRPRDIVGRHRRLLQQHPRRRLVEHANANDGPSTSSIAPPPPAGSGSAQQRWAGANTEVATRNAGPDTGSAFVPQVSLRASRARRRSPAQAARASSASRSPPCAPQQRGGSACGQGQARARRRAGRARAGNRPRPWSATWASFYRVRVGPVCDPAGEPGRSAPSSRAERSRLPGRDAVAPAALAAYTGAVIPVITACCGRALPYAAVRLTMPCEHDLHRQPVAIGLAHGACGSEPAPVDRRMNDQQSEPRRARPAKSNLAAAGLGLKAGSPSWRSTARRAAAPRRAPAQLLPHRPRRRRARSPSRSTIAWYFINIVDAWVKPYIPRIYNSGDLSAVPGSRASGCCSPSWR